MLVGWTGNVSLNWQKLVETCQIILRYVPLVAPYSTPSITGGITGGAMDLVTKVEAARRLQLSLDTIERRLRRGELKGHKQPRPGGFTWLIEVPEEPPHTSSTQGGIPPLDTPAPNAEIVRLEELVEVLKNEVAESRRQSQAQSEAYQQQLESKDKQIEQLHVLLQQAQAALPAPRDNHSWWRFWQR
jgi:DNA-binding transcriptional MocR family regulator